MLIQPERVVSVPGAREREDPTMYSPVEGLQAPCVVILCMWMPCVPACLPACMHESHVCLVPTEVRFPRNHTTVTDGCESGDQTWVPGKSSQDSYRALLAFLLKLSPVDVFMSHHLAGTTLALSKVPYVCKMDPQGYTSPRTS